MCSSLVAQIRRELEDLPVAGHVQVTFDAIRKGDDGRVRRLPKLDMSEKLMPFPDAGKPVAADPIEAAPTVTDEGVGHE